MWILRKGEVRLLDGDGRGDVCGGRRSSQSVRKTELAHRVFEAYEAEDEGDQEDDRKHR